MGLGEAPKGFFPHLNRVRVDFSEAFLDGHAARVEEAAEPELLPRVLELHFRAPSPYLFGAPDLLKRLLIEGKRTDILALIGFSSI